MTAPDRAVALGVQLTRVHDTLRARLRSLREHLLDGDAAPTGQELAAHCLAFCAAVHTHHSGEDRDLLPALRRERPDLASIIDKLIEDHWLVAGILRRVEELAGRPADPRAVVGELDGLAAILESHFAFEERRIAAALDGLGPEAWSADVFTTGPA
jgi:hypothetical protein